MVEGKMYRTRMCPHYIIGRCSRNYSCSFAHANSQLRRPSFTHQTKRFENRGMDLRELLDRKRSSSNNRLAYGEDSRRSVRTEIHDSKRQQLDSQGNYSGRLRVLDETEDRVKAKKRVSPDSKLRLDEKLAQNNSEIKKLDNEKRKLEIYLGDKVQEADTLKIKIHELEMHLSVEKEEAKGITTRIKKFIKDHILRQHLQEELKSLNAQLQKLGEQLDMHATEPGYERVPKITDDEAGGKFSCPSTESPKQKRTRNSQEVHGTSNQVSPVSEDIGKLRLDKLSRQTEYHDQSRNSKESDTDGSSNDEHKFCTPEDKPERDTSPPSDATSADKYKVSEVSANEMEETLSEVGVTSKDQDLQCLPPPPFIRHSIHPEYLSEAAVAPAAVRVHVMDENVVEVDEMEESLPGEGGSSNDQDLQFLLLPPPSVPRTIQPESTVHVASGTPTGVTAHVMGENVVEVNEMEENLPEVGVASKDQDLPFLPPPPPFIPQNIPSKYKDNDADGDVSEPEEGELV